MYRLPRHTTFTDNSRLVPRHGYHPDAASEWTRHLQSAVPIGDSPVAATLSVHLESCISLAQCGLNHHSCRAHFHGLWLKPSCHLFRFLQGARLDNPIGVHRYIESSSKRSPFHWRCHRPVCSAISSDGAAALRRHPLRFPPGLRCCDRSWPQSPRNNCSSRQGRPRPKYGQPCISDYFVSQDMGQNK